MKTRTHSRSRFLGALILLAAFLQVFVWSPRNIQILQHKKQAHHHWILQQFQQQQQQKKKNSPVTSHYSWNETYVLPPPPPTQWRPTLFWTDDSTTTVPSWLVSYMEWHKEQRAQLLVLSSNETTTTTTRRNDFQFLILTCRDPVCGGVSDRLKSVPLLLQLAELYHRIFLIHWERPAPLEYFVMPHQLDWRLPLEPAGPSSYRSVTQLLSGLEDSDDVPVVHVTLQDQHGGSQWYNQIEEYRQQRVSPQEIRSLLLSSSSNVSIENTPRHFRDHFRSIWSALFVPSPWLATAIQQRQSDLGLSDNDMTYVAAHVRALYRPTQTQRYGAWAMHAVQCASALRPDVPVVLLSDSRQVAQAALEYAHSRSTPTIRVVVPPHEIVHLDQPGPLQEHMDTFVDLYIMTHAQCISHGRGGYGRLGVLLSRNASCFFNYYQAGKTVLCDA